MADDAVFNAALAWWHVGACVLPAATDGSKRPGLSSWKQFQTERPDLNNIATWFATGQPGMGVVCGKVSGGLEMVEFEARAMDEGAYEAVAAALEADGYGQQWAEITAGYVEESPTGGRHLYYYIGDGPVPANTKIARRAASVEELAAAPDDRIKVLIETRGEGGWVVTAPSNGATHPSGRPWTVVAGSPATIPTITRSVRDSIVRIMQCQCDDWLDGSHVNEPAPARLPGAEYATPGLRPGDDFEARTTWAEILESHGWRKVGQNGRTIEWCRPGKRGPHTSATTGNAVDRDRLYVFSSSTPFEPETPYTKFGAYALLNHGGDHSAAAKALKAQGFGDDTDSQTSLIAALIPPSTAQSPLTVSQPAGTAAVMPSNPDELDVATWMAQTFRDELRFTPGRKGAGWYVWTGRLWERQHVDGRQWGYVERALRQVPNPKGLLKWGSAQTVAAVERLARQRPELHMPPSAWDPDQHLLNTPAGIVDLRDFTMLAHAPERYCTRITTYAPDPQARDEKFMRFLAETFQGDNELLTYVHRLLGCSLFGGNAEQVIPLCHGQGGNGKSVLLMTVLVCVGTYGAKANSDWFMVRSNGPHSSEAVVFDGPRIIFTSEANKDARFDEQRLKEYSGGETITARPLFGDFYSFTPQCTIWMLINNRPTVRQGGDSLFRRVREIPFEHRVPEDKIDHSLQHERIFPERGAAVMTWLIRGAVDYHQYGLIVPERVRAATTEYADESGGSVGVFLKDRCHVGGGDTVKMVNGLLFAAYQQWCAAEGVREISHKAFTIKAREYGVGEDRQSSQRFYTNVFLLDGDGDDE